MCKVCCKCFSKPAVLRQHFEQHKAEKREKRKEQANQEDDDDQRQYACEFPGK